MGYIRAEKILPQEIIELIQQYVEGENIYIPKKVQNRAKWGANTNTRQELEERNNRIFSDYLNGMGTNDLSNKYFLSEKSIQRIIYNIKHKILNIKTVSKHPEKGCLLILFYFVGNCQQVVGHRRAFLYDAIYSDGCSTLDAFSIIILVKSCNKSSNVLK